MLLGGRGAEQLVFQELSTGAHDDLQRATDLARQMVTRYGMSEALGPAAFEAAALYMPESLPKARPEYSEGTAELIDAEIHKLLAAALERVRATLSVRRPELEALAQELLRHETVDRATLTAILAAPAAPAPAAKATTDAPAEVSSAA